MNATDRKLLHDRRFVLQNPYAHMEEIEGKSRSHSNVAASIQIQRRRKTAQEIAEIAATLHRKLWRSRGDLWSESGISVTPIGLLDPRKAATLLDLMVCDATDLGTYETTLGTVIVAGVFDRAAGQIQISTYFPPAVQRFTAAHEIGHAVLHPTMTMMHRDRALEGVMGDRDNVEREADLFATYFLMPEKLVRTEFELRFLTQRFELNENTEYALGVRSRGRINRRQVSRVLASAVQFNGKYFYSLAEYFKLSVEAVALRLEELGLC